MPPVMFKITERHSDDDWDKFIEAENPFSVIDDGRSLLSKYIKVA